MSDQLQALRIDYSRDMLLEQSVAQDPIEQFTRWFEQAKMAGIREPNAMTLATVDSAGVPSARIVLLKSLDSRGFVFYTNYDSAKGHDLATNVNAALVFFWETMERQVRIQGLVEKVSTQETADYFAVRPRKSQIGAWASAQSKPIVSREELEQLSAELETRFAGQDIPPPPNWGGYRVIPKVIEFWQGRRSRLHDRLQYVRSRDGTWLMQRLSP